MKAEDFLNQRTPKSRGSKLAPAWPEIRKLREAGCSLYEIQDFLKKNNIETSVPNLAAFIKRQDKKTQPTEVLNTQSKPTQNDMPKTEGKAEIQKDRGSAKSMTPKDLKDASEQEINLDDYKNLER